MSRGSLTCDESKHGLVGTALGFGSEFLTICWSDKGAVLCGVNRCISRSMLHAST